MRKSIIDIQEMSDSKEVYGQRPNPFISWFIYCLVALLAVALIYSFIGKIEIVAKGSGIIRPNDDVSTVSSLVSGRITGVYYADGQFVQAGDTLFTVDTSEPQIVLGSLLSSKEKYTAQQDMLDKFLAGIQSGSNPFSSEPDSEEYPYYIQFRDFLLSLQNSRQSLEYDISKNSLNIQTLEAQIADLQYQREGLEAYKRSIEQGKNLASEYPEYANMYLLYTEELNALQNDYEAQERQIMSGSSEENNVYYLNYYQEQLSDCNLLIESIEKGRSVFPAGNKSISRMLYDDYCSALEEYQRAYDKAAESYSYYLSGGNVGGNADALRSYNQTMLEGYNYYLQSVTSGQDQFDAVADSAFYRSLYTEYMGKYDLLECAIADAQEEHDAKDAALQVLRTQLAGYEDAASKPDADEETIRKYHELQQSVDAAEAEVSVLKSEIDAARSARDTFKADTILTINHSISQIKASIAEQEVSIGASTLEYNTATAKMQMESAAAAIETYKNSKLLEYKQRQSELTNKTSDLNLSIAYATDKGTLSTALDKSYADASAQKRYQTISQIDSSIQSIENELTSAGSSLRLYEITAGLYENNVDEDGNPVSISMATIEQVSSIMNSLETVKTQIQEIDSKLEQTQEQITHGTITAERAGVINAASTIVTGDIIPSGNVVATIIPTNESAYKVQIYLNSADVGNVEVGDVIKYNITALPSNQYGIVSGKVLSISQDALLQDGQYSGYFLIEGSIDNAELTDKDGNSGKISIGMQTEVKIVTQEKSIFRYLMEKINLF